MQQIDISRIYVQHHRSSHDRSTSSWWRALPTFDVASSNKPNSNIPSVLTIQCLTCSFQVASLSPTGPPHSLPPLPASQSPASPLTPSSPPPSQRLQVLHGFLQHVLFLFLNRLPFVSAPTSCTFRLRVLAPRGVHSLSPTP